MDSKINQNTLLSQEDVIALELGRKILAFGNTKEIANDIDKAIFFVATHKETDTIQEDIQDLVCSLFTFKWLLVNFQTY